MAKKRECKNCLEEEEWRPVVGYEGRYEVSSHGRVRSIDITITDSLGRTRRQAGRLLKSHADRGGYLMVELRNGLGRKHGRKGRSVHRLVAEAFVAGGTQPKVEVMHLDHDPSHNCTGNLAWGSHAENVQATVAAGRHASGNTIKTHCPRGHAYDITNGRGDRLCRVCRNAAAARSRERKRELA